MRKNYIQVDYLKMVSAYAFIVYKRNQQRQRFFSFPLELKQNGQADSICSVCLYSKNVKENIFSKNWSITSIKQQPNPKLLLSQASYHSFLCKKYDFSQQEKCTLPLCEQCLPIHKKQHINNKQIPNQGILQFQTARSDALTAFEERRDQLLKVQQRFKGKVIEYRSRIMEVVDEILDKFTEDCLITDGNLQIIVEIDSRVDEIKRGSLKELIKYYEDTYGAEHFRKLYKMYTGQYLFNYKFQLDKVSLQNICKYGIKDLNFQSTSQTPIQSPKVQNITQIKKQNSKESFNKLHLNKQSKPNQPEQIENIHKLIKEKFPHKQEISKINERKKALTEEDEEQSQIMSYQLLKSKKKVEDANIYTENPSKIIIPSSKISIPNASNVSRSTSKKKKGLSLTKSYKQLISPQTSNISQAKPQEEQESSNNTRKSDWKKFIIMKQTHPQAFHSVIAQPKQVLNPRQMRQMLLKKKVEQKQKQLKGNKSVQHLIPREMIQN